MRLIDADALPTYTGYALSADEVAKAVEKAPTIEAEPVRRGKWVLDGKYNRHCSLCNENVLWSFNYCPNCGADMRGEKDE